MRGCSELADGQGAGGLAQGEEGGSGNQAPPAPPPAAGSPFQGGALPSSASLLGGCPVLLFRWVGLSVKARPGPVPFRGNLNSHWHRSHLPRRPPGTASGATSDRLGARCRLSGEGLTSRWWLPQSHRVLEATAGPLCFLLPGCSWGPPLSPFSFFVCVWGHPSSNRRTAFLRDQWLHSKSPIDFSTLTVTATTAAIKAGLCATRGRRQVHLLRINTADSEAGKQPPELRSVLEAGPQDAR